MKFKELSDWIIIDRHCTTRIIKNGNINNIQDRVAFIEKTPRVRVNKNKYAIECEDGFGAIAQGKDAWIYGNKDSEYGMSKESRRWCDNMLRLLGWE